MKIPFRVSPVSSGHLRGFALGPTLQACSSNESGNVVGDLISLRFVLHTSRSRRRRLNRFKPGLLKLWFAWGGGHNVPTIFKRLYL